MTYPRPHFVIALALGLILGACATPPAATPGDDLSPPKDGALQARARMISSYQTPIGEVTFTQTEEGVEVRGLIRSLEPNSRHGFHVHENGVCDAPKFQGAGGHFNPHDHEHGAPDDEPPARHVGDFGNLESNQKGQANFSFVDPVITLEEGPNQIVGKALIVHFGEDDLETQPTGDAGGRLGCGIIEWVK